MRKETEIDSLLELPSVAIPVKESEQNELFDKARLAIEANLELLCSITKLCPKIFRTAEAQAKVEADIRQIWKTIHKM
jgi:hypothetical protein